ncbi:MAG TPA: glycogen-binding domain-containing protein [Verrucomicrobiae bacterium]|jgi:1,4-alpha-glucan branching enzyme
MAKKTTSKSNNNGSTSTGNGKGHLQTFSLRSPGAMNVQLVGDFTQWQQHPITLQKTPDGVWKANVELPAGVHHYRFMVDGEWRDDPDCTLREPNPFGSENMKRQVA